MLRLPVLVVMMAMISCCLISGSEGQMNTLKNAVGGASECMGKLPDCNSNKPNDQDRDQKRAYCCSSAAWSRCVQRLIDSTCPGIPMHQIISSIESGAAGTYCEGYTFWTPECLYTNYMIAVIGSAAGLIAVLLLIVICVCCCCCRSKK